MNRLRALMLHPKRYFRSKGFGVHSPFAFTFIREVMRKPRGYAYYAYGDINKMAGRSDRLRTLFRIVCHTKPASVWSIGRNATMALEVAKKANSAIRELPCDKAALIIVSRMADGAEPTVDLGAIIANQATVVMTDTPKLLAAIEAEAANGMIFRKGAMSVAVLRRHLPRQTFNIV